MKNLSESRITWKGTLAVDKFAPEAVSEARAHFGSRPLYRDDLMSLDLPYETQSVYPANILTNTAQARIAQMIVGNASFTNAPWNISYVRMGVGTSTTAAQATDTDLLAATGAANRYWALLDATYPQVSAAVITYRATFADTVANFAWNEWGLDLVTAGSPAVGTGASTLLLNRKVTSLGTKASGAIWIATATLTITSS